MIEEPQTDVQTEYDDTLVATIRAHMEEGEEAAAEALLSELGPADLADMLAKVKYEERLTLLEHFPALFKGDVFIWLDHHLAKELLEELPTAQVAELLGDLETDDAINLIEDLSPAFQKRVLKLMSASDRAAVEEGLTYPEDSAGRLMQRDFVAIPRFWTVGKTIDYMREAGEDDLPENFTEVFVIDPLYHLVGEIPLNRILRAKRGERIEDLTLEEVHPVEASTDQEDVARMFSRESLTSAPVVDEKGRLIGVITHDDVVGVIEEEAQEDILRLGGLDTSDIHKDLWQTTWARFGWLFINLFTAILASLVISQFEASLEKIVALAVLMPIVASMGGNAGTQTLTVAVRALATKDLSSTNMVRVVVKETAVGFLNGIGFALIMGVLAYVWFNDPNIGLVIGAAMIINLVAAGCAGILIPLILDRFDLDPALSSAVFLTTVTDCVGFLAFLGLATLILL